MSKYAQMTDRDIQQAVLPLTWGKHPVRLLGKVMIDIPLSEYDPCNSWADAGPIIEQNNISLLCSTMCNQKAWEAMTPNGDEHWWEEKNPLRAAMIVFLMMHDKTEQEAAQND